MTLIDLKTSMESAGRNLLAVLDSDHDYAPTGGWLVTHDTGRWWDAMLRLEKATGFAIPAALEGAMLANLDRYTANPDHILLVPLDLEWATPRFELHSLREALLAFTALVSCRGSHWARQRGHAMLETLCCALMPNGTWDETCFDYVRHAGGQQGGSGQQDMTASTGRLIEALVWFYRATGDSLALDLAAAMAKYHLEHSTSPDGALPGTLSAEGNVGHSHSYLGTLRGLLLFGLLTHQQEYVARVAAAYRWAVPRVVKESGWAAHDLGRVRFRDRLSNPVPEVACAGDTSQIALWLALDAGYVDLLDDVSRLVCARLLPSQITEADATPQQPVTPRELGAYGGVHSLPHGGKRSTIDVTAAVLHTLTDVYRHIVTHEDGAGDLHDMQEHEADRCARREAPTLAVHFPFEYEDRDLSIEVTKETAADVTITVKTCTNVLVRIPAWAPRTSVLLTASGQPIHTRIGAYGLIPAQHTPGIIRLSYALPMYHTTETTATGAAYEMTWRGEEIIGIRPQDTERPFYPPG